MLCVLVEVESFVFGVLFVVLIMVIGLCVVFFEDGVECWVVEVDV